MCPKSQSQEAAEWGPHSQGSDSEDSVCFSGPVNTLWEAQLLAGKWSCPVRGWFNGWPWPLEESAEMPSLLLDLTAAFWVPGSCGLQLPELGKTGSLQKTAGA